MQDCQVSLKAESKGHQWSLSLACVRNLDTWYPHCAGNAKLSIKEERKIATQNNGLCLSKKYNSAHAKLKWQCGQKHVTELLGTPPSNNHRPDFLKTDKHPYNLIANMEENKIDTNVSTHDDIVNSISESLKADTEISPKEVKNVTPYLTQQRNDIPPLIESHSQIPIEGMGAILYCGKYFDVTFIGICITYLIDYCCYVVCYIEMYMGVREKK
nr:7445_t:CDS:2 [Entrophospora candida]